MPANKEAFIRYKIIDKLLRNKRKPYPTMDDFISELQEKLGKNFSDSTIQKDIKSMKEDSLLGYNAPIAYNRKYKGYWYTDETYTIAEIPLNEKDLASLEFAATVLQQFKDVKLFSEFGSAIDKIFNAINISSLLEEEELEDLVQFEKVPYFKGSNWISPLLDKIKNRETIQVVYQKFNSKETKTHEVHPYLLKEYRNRWYLIGMLEKNDNLITFGLDRIENIHDAEKKFRFNPKFSSKTYFKHAFGITTFEGEPATVVLELENNQVAYLKTQPLHHSQKIESISDSKSQLTINVGITTELEMTLLSFGNNVTVLKPNTLRESIEKKLKGALENYK